MRYESEHPNNPLHSRVVRRLAAMTATLLLSVAGIGCSAMKNGSMASVEPVTTNQRVGSVYLLRGWIGVFSTGIDSLGDEINAKGVHAEVYQARQWSQLASTIVAKYQGQPNHEPIVIVGHSYGADDSILITRALAEHGIRVNLVVTLDPVTPKKVPSNIDLVYNLYQSSALDNLPFFRGIPLTPDTPGPVALRNMNVRTDRADLVDGRVDHFNIEKKPKIHQDVIAQVLAACPLRGAWVASHSVTAPITVAAAPPATAAPTPVAAKPLSPNAVAVVSVSTIVSKGDAVVKR